MDPKWRTIAYAIPAGMVAAAAVGGFSFAISLLVPEIPGIRYTTRYAIVSYAMFYAGFLTIPYVLILLPIALTVSLHRVLSSKDPFAALKARTRLIAILTAMGILLWSSLWLVGVYIK